MSTVHPGVRGFSLVEVMVTVSILGILLATGLPAMSEWVANSRIRSSAESVMSGLQLARMEAVRRNANFRFLLVGTNGKWQITREKLDKLPSDPTAQPLRCNFDEPPLDDDHLAVIHKYIPTTANTAVSVNISSSGATDLIFGPNGWRSCAAGIPTVIIDVDSSAISSSESRDLRIVVQPGGSTRMCDPNVAAPDTRACPA